MTTLNDNHFWLNVNAAASKLDVAVSTVKKLGAQEVILTTKRGRMTLYARHDVEYLASARVRPFLPDEGQSALVCSLGVHQDVYPGQRPDLFHRPDYEWHAKNKKLALNILKNPTPETLTLKPGYTPQMLLNDKEILVTGLWGVKADNNTRLVMEDGIVLASYAGFILDGGRIVGSVRHLDRNGTRSFFVKPFTSDEKAQYCHTYLTPKQGAVALTYNREGCARNAIESYANKIGVDLKNIS